jgi:hypothetical protein|tara:strand:- start:54 stop:530 length:477 start_codon:yes stop_codon:yes gene_type:complete
MSWGTCYSGSNNIHFDFPPIMADGRNYATWQPGAVINEQIRQKEGIKTNWQYRAYLTNNADSIIKQNQLAACNDCCSCPARYTNQQSHSPNIVTMNKEKVADAQPFLYKSCTDGSQPYGYETSDLKNLYLSEQQLQSRMVTPVISQSQLLQQRFPNYN